MLSPRFVGKIVKVFLLCVACLLVVHFFQRFQSTDVYEVLNSNDWLSIVNSNASSMPYNVSKKAPRSANDAASFPSVEEIRRMVVENNNNARVYNAESYKSSDKISHVIVVQVHNRLNYLRYLIKSLEQSALVRMVLVIFSHDYFDAEINQLVQSIKFCRVMQIFYPYSIQLSPTSFPGQGVSDCSSSTDVETAKKLNCTGWPFYDRYSHYRNAQLNQIKHHWWWKINYVFNGMRLLSNYTGWVIFLEEDHYVSADFLYTFQYFEKNINFMCINCQLITMGRYNHLIKRKPVWNEYVISPWFASFHNMGMALNRSTWNEIHQCSSQFCDYDDYNWDWSLLYVFAKCMAKPLATLAVNAPRVFHTGACGVHHKGCESNASIEAVQKELTKWKTHLFPKEFKPGVANARMPKLPRENGGWNDPRDHQLCKRIAQISLLNNGP